MTYVYSNMPELSSRQLSILDELRRDGRVEVGALARFHEVTETTIRRDLAELQRLGSVRRFHGGAELGPGGAVELPFAERELAQRDEKVRIAAAAIEEVPPGGAVYLDVGSTTLEVARLLCERDDLAGLTVVTASVRVLEVMADEPARVISLGGELRSTERSLVGPLVEAVLERLWIDVGLIGVAGVDARSGLTESNLADAAVKRAVLARTNRIVVVADHTKIGHTAGACGRSDGRRPDHHGCRRPRRATCPPDRDWSRLCRSLSPRPCPAW